MAYFEARWIRPTLIEAQAADQNRPPKTTSWLREWQEPLHVLEKGSGNKSPTDRSRFVVPTLPVRTVFSSAQRHDQTCFERLLPTSASPCLGFQRTFLGDGGYAFFA